MASITSEYVKSLTPAVQARYMEKLTLINNVDPYLVDPSTCSMNLEDFPKVNYFDIVNYLVFKKSGYTQEEFRAYKSLEAYNLFVCKWVKKLCVKQIPNSENVLILSQVMHSQRLNLPPTNTWCVARNAGEIVAGHCDCIAGLGECCSHVGATLFAIEDIVRNTEEISVTGKKAYWAVPSCTLGEPDRIANINYSTKRDLAESDEASSCSESDSEECTAEERNAFEQKLNDAKRKPAIMSVLPPYCFSVAEERDKLVVGQLKNLYSSDNTNKSLDQLINLGKTVDLTISENVCKSIETATRGQNKNDAWFEYREGRITASLFKACCRTKIEKPALSTIKAVCYKKIFSAKQTEYGCHHEKNAVEAYYQYMRTRHLNFQKEDCGLFINSQFPFFGASPDSLVSCDCCGFGCLEVKCPYCVRNVGVEELARMKNMCLKSAPLTENFNNIELDKNHTYYYQVQMQIAVSERQFCDFVVWSAENFYFERVYQNRPFWDSESHKAQLFFERVIMPELLAKYFTRNEEMLKPLQAIQPSAVQTPELWCKCQKPDDGSIMICCNNENCNIKWFHLKCINRKRVPKGDWYCVQCKKETK